MTDRHSNHTIHSVSHHFGWDNSNKPIQRVRSGTIIEIETLDSSGEQLNINSTIEDVKNLDFSKVDRYHIANIKKSLIAFRN